MPPSREDVEAMEDSSAKETLREFPAAAGAYDRVPVASASAVWTLDTSTDIFLLHSIQVQTFKSLLLLNSSRQCSQNMRGSNGKCLSSTTGGLTLPVASSYALEA